MLQPWHSFRAEDHTLLTPGEVRKISVEIFPSSVWIPPGSSLRVSVNTSNVAQGLPPLLTGLTASRFGTMTLHTGPDTPSSLVLPVVPADSLQ